MLLTRADSVLVLVPSGLCRHRRRAPRRDPAEDRSARFASDPSDGGGVVYVLRCRAVLQVALYYQRVTLTNTMLTCVMRKPKSPS